MEEHMLSLVEEMRAVREEERFYRDLEAELVIYVISRSINILGFCTSRRTGAVSRLAQSIQIS